jgi:hypothetical protein
MPLIFLVSSGMRKCFVCDSGTQEKTVENHCPTLCSVEGVSYLKRHLNNLTEQNMILNILMAMPWLR